MFTYFLGWLCNLTICQCLEYLVTAHFRQWISQSGQLVAEYHLDLEGPLRKRFFTGAVANISYGVFRCHLNTFFLVLSKFFHPQPSIPCLVPLSLELAIRLGLAFAF